MTLKKLKSLEDYDNEIYTLDNAIEILKKHRAQVGRERGIAVRLIQYENRPRGPSVSDENVRYVKSYCLCSYVKGELVKHVRCPKHGELARVIK